MFRYGCVIILFIVVPVLVFSQQTTVSVDRDSVGVGDAFSYKITVNNPAGVDDIVYPDSTIFSQDFDVEGRNTFSGVHADSVVYNLRYFGNQDAEIPGLPVGLVSGRDTVWISTAPVPLVFVSRVSEEDQAFRPFKPLYEFSVSLLPYILGFIVFGLIAWFLWRQYKRRPIEETPAPTEPIEIPPFRDPLIILEQDLQAIDANYPQPEEDYKAYYYKLSDAIRSYFEELYAIPALESTTSELERELKKSRIHNELQSTTVALLEQADMVKFAKFAPDATECHYAMDLAYHFLEEAWQIDGPKVDRLKARHDEMILKLTEKDNTASQPAVKG